MRALLNHKNMTAFSTIELLVVVSVIGALLALLLPALHRARIAGMCLKCAGNLRSIAQGLVAYAEANEGDLLPTGMGVNPEFEFGGWQSDLMYAARRPLNPYLGLKTTTTEPAARVFECPADSGYEGYPSSLYLTEQYRVPPFQDRDRIILEQQEEVECACANP
jgi:hypothetical protein